MRGIHIFGKGKCPKHGVKSKTLKKTDLFTELRVVALTGINTTGSANVDLTLQITALATEHYPLTIALSPENWTDKPDPRCTMSDNDDELIKIA